MFEFQEVMNLNVNEGTIKVRSYQPQYEIFPGPPVFVRHGYIHSMEWVAANLSCVEAQQNISGYACVSIKSKCLALNVEIYSGQSHYIGYRCKCSDGFQGNPYAKNGCQGTSVVLYLSMFIGEIRSIVVTMFSPSTPA